MLLLLWLIALEANSIGAVDPRGLSYDKRHKLVEEIIISARYAIISFNIFTSTEAARLLECRTTRHMKETNHLLVVLVQAVDHLRASSASSEERQRHRSRQSKREAGQSTALSMPIVKMLKR